MNRHSFCISSLLMEKERKISVINWILQFTIIVRIYMYEGILKYKLTHNSFNNNDNELHKSISEDNVNKMTLMIQKQYRHNDKLKRNNTQF